LIKKRIEKKYNEIKNTSFINGTGNYGDNYKRKVIKHFNLDLKYTNMVMRMSYGDLMEITKDLNIPKY